MPTAFVIPARSREVDGPVRVRHPERQLRDQAPIAAEGETVELTKYIRRRLHEGDLVLGNAPSAPAAATPSEAQPVERASKRASRDRDTTANTEG